MTEEVSLEKMWLEEAWDYSYSLMKEVSLKKVSLEATWKVRVKCIALWVRLGYVRHEPRASLDLRSRGLEEVRGIRVREVSWKENREATGLE